MCQTLVDFKTSHYTLASMSNVPVPPLGALIRLNHHEYVVRGVNVDYSDFDNRINATIQIESTLR